MNQRAKDEIKKVVHEYIAASDEENSSIISREYVRKLCFSESQNNCFY